MIPDETKDLLLQGVRKPEPLHDSFRSPARKEFMVVKMDPLLLSSRIGILFSDVVKQDGIAKAEEIFLGQRESLAFLGAPADCPGNLFNG
jgi:hypothetical protein